MALPQSLKKPTLIPVPVYPEDMNTIGSLSNLQELVLNGAYVRGERATAEWNPAEGQFLKLKFLKIEDLLLNSWGAESFHFPSLDILVLERMGESLNQIPSEVGEIDALERIEIT